MTRKERIVQQRIYCQQAMGLLRSATELFGAEEGTASAHDDYVTWQKKIDELEEWLFSESPIA